MKAKYEKHHRIKKNISCNRANLLMLFLFSIFLGTEYTYPSEENHLYQQEIKVTGTISDLKTGEPLSGANIVVLGTSQGVTADIDGNYTLVIDFPSTPLKIEASYIGYASKVITVEIDGSTQTINIELSPEAQTLGGVVVTANKRGERLQEVPTSVQAITGETVEQIGIRDINEIIAFVPGASEDLSFGAGLRQYQIRGIPQGPGDPTVGYYVDDIAFNFFGFRWAPLGRTFDINRVEVLRGPQSTLYGAGAMGGVMKFVTNKPELDQFGLNAVAGGTSLNDGGSGFYGDLALNLPIVKDVLGIRLTGSYEEIGGFAENNPESIPEPFSSNANGTEASQFRAQLLFQPSSDFQIRASYYKNKNEQNGGALLSQLDPAILTGSAADFARADWEIISGTLEYDFDFATVTSTTSSINVDAVNTFSLFLGDVFGTGTPVGVITSVADNPLKGINHETRIVSKGDGPFKWLGGFYYVDSEAEFNSFIEPENPFFPASQSVSESRSPSGFAEVSYGFLDNKLTVLGGIRYLSDRRTFTENGFNFDPETGGFVPFTDVFERTFESWNPRFNISYQPNRNTNLYFNVAKGFRAGQWNTNGVVVQQNALGFPAVSQIDSDQIWSYELGTKLSLAENQLLLELAAYYQDWSDAIIQIGVVSFADYNVGNVVGQGFDFGMTYNPFESPWTINATANFNSTQFDDITDELLGIEDESVAIENGDDYPFVPSFTGAVSVNYTKGFGEKGWQTNNTISFSHRGEQQGNGNIVSDPLSLLRLRLGIENERYGISIYGNNLLNDRDANYSQRTPALTAFTPTLPLQLGIELRYKL